MNPKVSVIFPVGDRPAFLAEAIESVLTQTLADFEMIVVLDGVSEPVETIMAGYRDARIRTIRLPVNLGISNARNAALRWAKAPFLALMDSDDVAMPHRFENQLKWMEAHPDVTVCSSNSIKLLEDGRRVNMVYPETDGMIKARLLLVDSAILNPTAMIRSDFVKKHRLQYDANMPRDHDHLFYVAMMRNGARFYGLQEELLLYRRHAGNVTHDREGVDEEKTLVRERLLPVFFPELSGHEAQLLMLGLQAAPELSLKQACGFVAAANKAIQEERVFLGEDRRELKRILTGYLQRAMVSLGALTTKPAQAVRGV